MAVVKYRFRWWDTEEGNFTYHRKHTKTQNRRAWKRDVLQELQEEEENMASAFLVLNETTYAGDVIVTEVAAVSDDLQRAMDFIAEIAADNDVEVEDDANSVFLPVGEYTVSDEYYIVEMEKL